MEEVVADLRALASEFEQDGMPRNAERIREIAERVRFPKLPFLLDAKDALDRFKSARYRMHYKPDWDTVRDGMEFAFKYALERSH